MQLHDVTLHSAAAREEHIHNVSETVYAASDIQRQDMTYSELIENEYSEPNDYYCIADSILERGSETAAAVHSRYRKYNIDAYTSIVKLM